MVAIPSCWRWFAQRWASFSRFVTAPTDLVTHRNKVLMEIAIQCPPRTNQRLNCKIIRSIEHCRHSRCSHAHAIGQLAATDPLFAHQTEDFLHNHQFAKLRLFFDGSGLSEILRERIGNLATSDFHGFGSSIVRVVDGLSTAARNCFLISFAASISAFCARLSPPLVQRISWPTPSIW